MAASRVRFECREHYSEPFSRAVRLYFHQMLVLADRSSREEERLMVKQLVQGSLTGWSKSWPDKPVLTVTDMICKCSLAKRTKQ